jgi:hypothetical protein
MKVHPDPYSHWREPYNNPVPVPVEKIAVYAVESQLNLRTPIIHDVGLN